jgi:hypothetical protein
MTLRSAGTRDGLVANAIARREAAGGRKAIVRTAAAGRSRLGEGDGEWRPDAA